MNARKPILWRALPPLFLATVVAVGGCTGNTRKGDPLVATAPANAASFVGSPADVLATDFGAPTEIYNHRDYSGVTSTWHLYLDQKILFGVPPSSTRIERFIYPVRNARGDIDDSVGVLLHGVSPGMTKPEVEALLGKPDTAAPATWEYCRFNFPARTGGVAVFRVLFRYQAGREFARAIDFVVRHVS